MFDIGFSELVLIAIVALVVIGPERLPRVARTAGKWVGKMRNFVTSVQHDINMEMKAEELKKIMDEQARSVGIHDIIDDVRETGEEVKKQEYLLRAIPDEKPGEWTGDDDGSDLSNREPAKIESKEDKA